MILMVSSAHFRSCNDGPIPSTMPMWKRSLRPSNAPMRLSAPVCIFVSPCLMVRRLRVSRRRSCVNGGNCMESMNISLPESLKQFVDRQISAGRYSGAGEYVRELIRADEKRTGEEQLEAKLLEGL